MAKKTKDDKVPKEVMRIAWVLVIGALPPMLDSTMVNIALNKLMLDLHTNLNTIQWAITGYVLALAIAVPFSAWIMNHFNGKRAFALFVGLFGVGSILSGIAWNVQVFIAFRLIQGFAAGVVTLLLTSLLMASAPRDKLGQVMAVVTTPVILGPIVGPIIGGFIVQYGNWHWIFYVNIPIAILSVILTLKIMPDFKPFNPKSKMDIIGTLLLVGFSTGLMYGISQGSSAKNFFKSSEMWIFCGIGLACIIAYIIYDILKKHKTVLPLKFFAKRNYSAANIGVFLNGVAINGCMLILPLFFQNIKHFNTVEAALIMIPQGAGMLIARPVIGKLIDNFGAKPVVLVSLVISLVGSFPFVFVTNSTSLWWIGVVLFIRGIGVGGLTMPLMTDIYTGIENNEIPAASAGNRIIQNVGSSFGSAVISAVVTAVVTNYMTDQANDIKSKTMAKVTDIIKTTGKKPSADQITAIGQTIAKAFETNGLLNGYQMGFLISCIALILILLPALFLSSKRKTV
ncbi:MDR family MFS transporter [Lactococcus nasutitermitis]|uniref:MDR family MFS transporter n=1 Tax=Lactococcus nasutitermitis TaxID=1652957 RepID=A0ABV9JEN9_9LACT|nr:MDR family MFS transporter [Lactococcus nasutitermitis]